MKINGLIACAIGFFAHLALAQETALVTKTNATGFTLPEYSRSETCEVFQNKVVITNKYGAFSDSGFTSQEVRRIQLSRSISKSLQAAAAETLMESDNYLCDGPSTSIQSTYAGKKITLFSTGGCGSPRLERQGGAAHMLMNLVATYCPTTHDFGIQHTTILD